MARKRVFTDESAAIAQRCRWLANSICQYEGRTQFEVFRQYFDDLPAKKVARLLDGTTKRWHETLIDGLTALTTDRYGFPTGQVRAYVSAGELVDGSLSDFALGRLHTDRLNNLDQLEKDLANRFDEAKEPILCVSRRCPFSQMTKEFATAYLDYEQYFGSLTAPMRVAKQRLIDKREYAPDTIGPARMASSMLGLLDSGLQELQMRSGHARFLGCTDAWIQLANFGQYTSRKHGMEVRVIPDADGTLDPLLQLWIDQYDMVSAVGTRFLMKIYRVNGKRVFFERSGDPAKDQILDADLMRLQALLMCHRHDTGRYALSEFFKRMADGVAKRAAEIRRKKTLQKEETHASSQSAQKNSADGFWLPNGTWMAYRE